MTGATTKTARLLAARATPHGHLVGPARPAYPTPGNRDSLIRWLAFERGYRGDTFSTAEDARHPGYDRAYSAGARAKRQESYMIHCMPTLRLTDGTLALVVHTTEGEQVVPFIDNLFPSVRA